MLEGMRASGGDTAREVVALPYRRRGRLSHWLRVGLFAIHLAFVGGCIRVGFDPVADGPASLEQVHAVTPTDLVQDAPSDGVDLAPTDLAPTDLAPTDLPLAPSDAADLPQIPPADLPLAEGGNLDQRADSALPDLASLADGAGAIAHRVFVGIQGVFDSRIASFNIDALGVATEGTAYDLKSRFGTGLRAFGTAGDRFLLGDSDTGRLYQYSFTMQDLGELVLTGRVPALPDLMGVCVSSSGTILVSSYLQKKVAEYDASGNYLREVFASTFHVSDCLALPSGDVILVDYNADTDDATIVRKIRLVGAQWQQSQQFTLTTVGTSTTSSAWTATFANGDLWIPPQHPSASGTRKLVRCLHSDLDACAEYGQDVPRIYPTGAVEAIGAIPNTGDLWIADHLYLMRFHRDGSIVDTIPLNQEVDWIRKLQVVPPP